MLQYDVAKRLYDEIREKAEKNTADGFDELYRTFLEDASDYARTRTAWSFMDNATRMDEDQGRTIKHDTVILMLGAVCRNLGIEGVDELMPDRKTKGDFACYVALFLALEQR